MRAGLLEAQTPDAQCRRANTRNTLARRRQHPRQLHTTRMCKLLRERRLCFRLNLKRSKDTNRLAGKRESCRRPAHRPATDEKTGRPRGFEQENIHRGRACRPRMPSSSRSSCPACGPAITRHPSTYFTPGADSALALRGSHYRRCYFGMQRQRAPPRRSALSADAPFSSELRGHLRRNCRPGWIGDVRVPMLRPGACQLTKPTETLNKTRMQSGARPRKAGACRR